MIESKKKRRQEHLDLIAGLLIIFMVFHHAYPDTFADTLLSRFLFFYMSWFFFKAGMFFNENDTLKETTLKSVRRLLVPFFIFFVVGQIVLAFDYLKTSSLHCNFLYIPFVEVLLNGSASGNTPLWFLFTLFFVRLIYSILTSYIKNVCILIFVFGAFALFFHFMGIRSPLFLGNICLGCMFFGLGYYIKDLQYNDYIFWVSLITYFFAIFLFPIIGSFVLNTSDNYLWWLLASLTGTITINNIFNRFKIKSFIFSFCGRHSLEILVSHMPIINLITKIAF